MTLRKVKLNGINNQKDKQTCGILIETKRGEEWANGWKSPRTEALNKGEEIFVELYEEEYNGKTYLKFRLPSLDALLARLDTAQVMESVQQATGESVTKEISVDDIPF